jgi:uncharacterized protein YndB with AHSA1/START domain
MFTSELFHAFTPARPRCVWDLLTISGTRADYLFGMTVESCWQPGSPVTMTAAGQTLAGEVISADPGHRLCYTLGDQPGDPSVYVTWQLREASDGTYIRLSGPGPAGMTRSARWPRRLPGCRA